MNDFPKYPTDFSALIRPFEDEEIERLLAQPIKDVVFTIDILKTREVNATTALMKLRNSINAFIEAKEKELYDSNSILSKMSLRSEIADLENIICPPK